jgi:coenzyme Q-binding protein COQ10
MPEHRETKILPFTPEQVFAVVNDVENYHHFLPWCQKTRVYNRQDGQYMADVMIGYKMIREKYTSRVHYEAPHRISVEYITGPFQRLQNTWSFTTHPDGCQVDFFIDFEFRSLLLQKLASSVFYEVVKHMVHAFEQRAISLHGKQE